MKRSLWRTARRVVQAGALVMAIALVVATYRDVTAIATGSDLLRLDPLAGLAASLASRRVLVAFAPAAVMLILAIVLGRAWCGWLCPLGTLIDWAGARRAASSRPSEAWRGAKTVVLLSLGLGALWGNLTLLALDPLTLFVRSMTTVLLPGLHWLLEAMEAFLYQFMWLYGPLDAIDRVLRGTLISYKQPAYVGMVGLVTTFVGVLALNLWAPRAWCRYLCPLGGLYSWLARVAPMRRQVSDKCAQCGRCAEACPMATVDPERSFASDSAECILCMDCVAACPVDAIHWAHAGREGKPVGGPLVGRRQVLAALAGSVGLAALQRIGASAQKPHPRAIRPPGAQEEALLAACVRCGVCLRTCPTHGLQPSLTTTGIEGLWTPILVPRLGPCDYACHACGDACPTGAIPRLDLETKRRTPIGKAYIDPALCIAWSGRGPCIVCEEMCPLPEKAIHLEEMAATDASGIERAIQVPVVQHDRCIGCGLCENKCPVVGEAAIRVRVDPMG